MSESLCQTLSAITDDPVSFQCMMRRTRAIISGSTALHHILRQPTAWQPGDVDLLVPHHRFRDVTRFILALPGAVIVNEYSQKYKTPATGFSHIVQVQTRLVKFDIIQSSEGSPFHPIAYYYGTHVMNAITADFVICSYPTLTLHGRSFLVPRRNQNMTDAIMRAVRKYKERGFQFMEPDAVSVGDGQPCGSTITCPHRNRAMGDHFCLIMPNTERPVWETWGLMDEHQSTTWKLSGEACGNPVCYLEGQLTVGTTTWGEVGRITTAL